MNGQYKEQAIIFKAFCDENRLMILEMLRDGEKCACVLLERLNISQSTLSHHMKILVDSGIVVSRKDGKWRNSPFQRRAQSLQKSCLMRLPLYPDGRRDVPVTDNL